MSYVLTFLAGAAFLPAARIVLSIPAVSNKVDELKKKIGL